MNKPKLPLVLDIETRSDAGLLSTAAGQAILERKIKAPKNYKDQEKIDAYMENAIAEAHDKAALSPLLGKIVCIGVGFPSLPIESGGENAPTISFWDKMDDEAQILSRFTTLWQELSQDLDPVLIGYNNRRFDHPYLTARMARWSLGPKSWPHARDYYRVFDLMEKLGDTGRLDDWLQVFGIGAKSASGSEVKDMAPEDVARYCDEDVRLTMKLFERLSFAIDLGDSATWTNSRIMSIVSSWKVRE